MGRIHLRRSTLAATALALSVLAVAPAAGAAQKQGATGNDLFNARYCEVLEVTGALPKITVNVWNTIGLNDCPQDRWKAIDANALAAERGAAGVVLNGPRYFVMDRATTAKISEQETVGGLPMREVASIPITKAEELRQTPYTDRTITRRNTWEWRRGRQIYELLTPSGGRYVMQAYAQIVDPNQTLSSLKSLGSRLQLPDGWRFRTRRLRDDLVLRAKGSATILQDELQNTYQRVR